ncbi:hypothetical protein ACFFNY_10275 [Paenibacillus hodogayensis]|uniref:Uncharacterized protein n=1 Tax=Paenibacillus hodogayensis TaxID=279208 RepID=A0ABV5VVB3_9BACL
MKEIKQFVKDLYSIPGNRPDKIAEDRAGFMQQKVVAMLPKSAYTVHGRDRSELQYSRFQISEFCPKSGSSHNSLVPLSAYRQGAGLFFRPACAIEQKIT